MFKWIIILTLMSGSGEKQDIKYMQGESIQAFSTLEQCQISMEKEINALITRQVVQLENSLELNIAQCAFFSTLKQVGTPS